MKASHTSTDMVTSHANNDSSAVSYCVPSRHIIPAQQITVPTAVTERSTTQCCSMQSSDRD
eukprot:6427-Heterococcus_DN1.PRE.3